MSNETNNPGGIPIMAEPIGYVATEMIACGKCVKANPPNRLNCLYCGTALELSDEVAAGIRFRPADLEDWESGVNLIATYIPADLDLDYFSSLIAVGEVLTDSLAAVEPPIPLFRIRAEDSDELTARMARLGLTVVRIPDADLLLSVPPVRLKGIEVDEKSFTFYSFNSGSASRVDVNDVKLIVLGSVVTVTAESKLKKKRKETKEFDEYTASSDQLLVDIHTSADSIGYRITSTGFDFSFLGDEKALIAGENIKNLIDKVSAIAPHAIVDRSYATKSAILDTVWPRKVTNTSKGIQRTWFGVQRASGFTTSNEAQFTRYSRMLRHLL